jgi:hypothetical protein
MSFGGFGRPGGFGTSSTSTPFGSTTPAFGAPAPAAPGMFELTGSCSSHSARSAAFGAAGSTFGAPQQPASSGFCTSTPPVYRRIRSSRAQLLELSRLPRPLSVNLNLRVDSVPRRLLPSERKPRAALARHPHRRSVALAPRRARLPLLGRPMPSVRLHAGLHPTT